MRRRDRRGQRRQPHRRGAGFAACADLQLRHRLAHRAGCRSGPAGQRVCPARARRGRGLAGLAGLRGTAGRVASGLPHERLGARAVFAAHDAGPAAAAPQAGAPRRGRSPATSKPWTSASATTASRLKRPANWSGCMPCRWAKPARPPCCSRRLRGAVSGAAPAAHARHRHRPRRGQGAAQARPARRRAGLAALGQPGGGASAFSATSSRAWAC